jgi:hypothetical protein
MDLTGKVKFGTADVDKGLGTGENDYTVQADFYKFVDRFTWLGSVGYVFRGDPPAIDLNNAVKASLGGTCRFTPDVMAGLFFDYRESAIPGNDSIQELSGFVSRRLSVNRIHGQQSRLGCRIADKENPVAIDGLLIRLTVDA